MFDVGDYVLDKKTNEKFMIISKANQFYLVKGNGYTIGKFEWELKKCNFLRKIWR